MWKIIVRRILIMIPQVVLLSILVFLMAKAMPGDALSGMLDPNIDPAAIDAMREKLGLNDPWYIQYWDWITKAIQGDFGQSFRFKICGLRANRSTPDEYPLAGHCYADSYIPYCYPAWYYQRTL